MVRIKSKSNAFKSKILEEMLEYLKKANPSISELKKIPLNVSLLEKGYLDSFGVIEMITFIEKNWKIKINDSDLTTEKMGSINKMISLIYNKKK